MTKTFYQLPRMTNPETLDQARPGAFYLLPERTVSLLQRELKLSPGAGLPRLAAKTAR